MKFKTYLTEALDKPYPLKIHFGRKMILGSFSTPSSNVEIELGYLRTFDYWDLSFYRDHEIKMTGGGDAFRIFATVIDFLRKVLQKDESDLVTPLDKIVFGAEKDPDESNGRVRLYNRLVKKFARNMGYNVRMNENAQGNLQKYILTKIDAD